MEKRKLGHSSLEITPLCFGGNVFGWTVDEKMSFLLLDHFVEKGFNCIDTADIYSTWASGNKGGESETIIGKWMKSRGNRKKIVVATKVGMKMGEGREGLSRKWIRQEVEDSLKRLQTDYIDLYQSHKDDPSATQEETLSTYAELVKEGKVRFIGASNFSAERLSSSLKLSKEKGYPAYQTLQPLYNLCERAGFEKELEPLCVKEDISVISYFSLASGFLTGKYLSKEDLKKSTRGAGVAHYLNERGLEILRALDTVSGRYNTKPAVVALAWLMQRPAVAAPIASATSIDQLDELMSAADLKLDTASVALLDTASNPWR